MTRITRRKLLTLVPVTALGSLAACGFKPLLAEREGTPSIQTMLSSIQVSQIGEGRERRLGQILRNELIDRFVAGKGMQSARYVLDVAISQNLTPLIIQSSNTITRSNLVVTARFELRDLASGEPLYRSTASATGSHDIVVSEYSSQVARQDTARKAVKDLANTITYLLSFHFARAYEPSGS